ncbi:nucleic acid-binding protein [Parahaliea maris]|uniref:Nucleic acid-binding protein n=1 Tax=Parahaliea maris TaxID=2716870 RepID=A0A5C9A4N2_9GAMM|nr:OB-fold domain-containing protein [Parahaliea maris]TXS95835.1 nucleic acid-binding protein [Parahaliea maris]
MNNELPLRPAPIRKRDNLFFWDGAKLEELRIQKCNCCGKLQHPPGPMCPQCLETDMGYQVCVGRGRVYSWIIPRYPELPMFSSDLVVALIELEEGVRILSNICDVAHEDIRQGMEVELFFAATQDDGKVPQFRPATQ